MLLVCAFVVAPSGARSQTLTVNSTNDVDDGLCDGTHCSLREAINAANAALGSRVVFDIAGAGPHTIRPASALPQVTTSMVIDGTSEPDYAGTPVVELDGSNAGTSHGLHLIAGSSTIRGLAINRFSGNGIDMGPGTSGNVIEANHIGTDASGTVSLGNDHGILVFASSDNVIGGTTPASRNVISGNDLHGVEITQSGATRNVVVGNHIGLDAGGTAPLANGWVGVQVTQAPGNRIGGTEPGSRNVISANAQSGVRIVESGSTGNVVLGNYLGTDATGTADLGNVERGVEIIRASDNTVGGTTAEARNVISGNDASGVYITLAGLVGVASRNVISGNYIGTDLTGSIAVGNFIGVQIFGDLGEAASNTVGGDAERAGNLISGNESTALMIHGPTASDNTVAGNLVGTDATGGTSLANGGSGVFVNTGSTDNTIGGTTPASRNVISGNVNGVTVVGIGTRVVGNYIGTSADGIADIGNQENGVRVFRLASGTVVGGSTPEERNVISGNGHNGIRIFVSDGTPAGTLVRGNYVGTDVAGSNPLPNDRNGVLIEDVPGNVIGGTAPGEGNVISGNGLSGVRVEFAAATGNIIAGNLIGTAANGTDPMGNAAHGVIVSDASDNRVGGTDEGAGNVIAFNGDDGIQIALGSGNAIQSNSIHSNAGLGISLGSGVVLNDQDDVDAGANGLLNFPVLTSVYRGATTIGGTYGGASTIPLRLELFQSPECDASGHGEGAELLGVTDVSTDASGQAAFALALPAALDFGVSVAATATDPDGNTSEFSACASAADFAVEVPGETLSVSRGGSATLEVSVSPDGGRFVGEVALSCSGLVEGTTCSFSPPTVSPGADGAVSTLTVGAEAVSRNAMSGRPFEPPPPWIGLLVLAGAGLWLRLRRHMPRPVAAMALAAVLLLSLGACNDGTTDPPSPVEFSLTVTGTSEGLSREATIAVTVS